MIRVSFLLLLTAFFSRDTTGLFHTQRKREIEMCSDFKHNGFAAAVGRNRRSGSCAPR
ncbi:hypothetical protein HanRHA438_Chr07g0293941 [Helianthus annuus]|uniref:Uncharacterized protein n=1 Tax=Helianthus annuus TaxID=4232 RepID=A0A251UB11_HELAN|nr:hypothetical protein HanXRQr2_Chr07g0283481 [Helianthus annuus]KAJ0549378.1 hypothetical protein HanHA300_Chr07g0232891 [Helianthus annuus]KAJ0555724.1 hypothetical protein HanIR_Chr07g0305361 [Helianthus annuus]KAJ0562331.1 hypothetical protein HanHA89_Chr07g0250051 [Helianthus annuus]KAJ0903813.1 hypothetical protein HanPSC8_Chr07g0274321 [Helianthus annuus]